MGALARAMTGKDAGGAAAANAAAADGVAAAVDTLLADETLPERLVGWLGTRDRTVILGRGAARAAAEMGALTLKEAVGIPVEALQTAQFRHGPLELAGPGLAAIVIATEPETADLDRALAEDLAGLGSAVLFVAAGGTTPEGDVTSIDVGPLDRLVCPAAAIVPAQLLAWRLSVRGGLVPGELRIATKVTTRE
jgi:glucosamine--fructose-6-phosphate aminotransferase (isomerizing)